VYTTGENFLNILSIEFSIWEVRYQGMSTGARFFAASLHKADDHTAIKEDDMNHIFEILNDISKT